MFHSLRTFLQGIRSLPFIFSLPTSDVLLFCHDYTRSYLYQDLYYSPAIDSFSFYLKRHNLNFFTLARSYSSLPPKDCFGSVYVLNSEFAIARFLDRVASKISFIFHPYIGDISCFQLFLWYLIIRRVQPKVILGVEPLKELCTIASILDIPSFDFQHGALGSYDDVSPIFHTLKYRSPFQLGWPHYIITWDKASHDWISTHRSQFTKSLPLGNLWHYHHAHVQPSIKDSNTELLNTLYKPSILVSLQHTRNPDRSIDSFYEIPGLFEFITSSFGQHFNWSLRLHPLLMHGKQNEKSVTLLESVFNGFTHVDWTIATSIPLPSLLSMMNVHITRDSSVSLECANYGIPTLFVSNSFCDSSIIYTIYSSLFASNLALICDVDISEDFSRLLFDSCVTPIYPDNVLNIIHTNFSKLADVLAAHIRYSRSSSSLRKTLESSSFSSVS